MGNFLAIVGALGAVAALAMFAVRLIAKKGLGYKQLGVVLGICVVLFVVGVGMDSSPRESTAGDDVKESSSIKESFDAGRQRGQEAASNKDAKDTKDKEVKKEVKKVKKSPSKKTPKQAPKKSEAQVNWNVDDIDVETNGNLLTAIALIGTEKDIKDKAEGAAPSAVMKSPWKYYGKVIGFTGEVAIIQEYPPGSEIAGAAGDEVGEIVLVTEDMTFVDYLHIGSTGAIVTGDMVTVYGYPVGIINADNPLGGQTQELCVVGNAIE